MFDFDDAVKDLFCMLFHSEAELLYNLFGEISPKTIVELGAKTGCSSTVFANLAKEHGGHLYSVEPVPLKIWHTNLQRLGLDEYATLIEAYSPWLTPEQWAMIPKPIDCLFIDSEHTTKCSLTDYHFWQRYIRKGGRIAFHDLCGGNGDGFNIQRTVKIILETDNLVELGRIEGSRRGTVVFEKDFYSV